MNEIRWKYWLWIKKIEDETKQKKIMLLHPGGRGLYFLKIMKQKKLLLIVDDES